GLVHWPVLDGPSLLSVWPVLLLYCWAYCSAGTPAFLTSARAVHPHLQGIVPFHDPYRYRQLADCGSAVFSAQPAYKYRTGSGADDIAHGFHKTPTNCQLSGEHQNWPHSVSCNFQLLVPEINYVPDPDYRYRNRKYAA